jgi:hypothetical protein
MDSNKIKLDKAVTDSKFKINITLVIIKNMTILIILAQAAGLYSPF